MAERRQMEARFAADEQRMSKDEGRMTEDEKRAQEQLAAERQKMEARFEKDEVMHGGCPRNAGEDEDFQDGVKQMQIEDLAGALLCLVGVGVVVALGRLGRYMHNRLAKGSGELQLRKLMIEMLHVYLWQLDEEEVKRLGGEEGKLRRTSSMIRCVPA